MPAAMPFPTEQVVALFAEGDRRQRRLRELCTLGERLCAAATLTLRLDAFERLVRFVTGSDKNIPEPGAAVVPGRVPPGPEVRRLSVLLAVLESCAPARAAVLAAWAAMLAETHGLALLAEAGLPNDRGLYNETTDRLFRRILPSPRDEHDLGKLVSRLFPSHSELTFLEAMPRDLFERLAQLLTAPEAGGAATGLLQAAADAFCLLGGRVQALGLSEGIRGRSQIATTGLAGSPFFRLPRAGDGFLAARAVGDEAAATARAAALRAVMAACREEIASVYRHLEETGISVDVVYELEAIERSLGRLDALLTVLAAAPGPTRAAAAHRLLVALAHARLSDRSLRDLARSTTRLLARKIIERAGHTGEHYITAGRREYWHMVASAAGGGFMTAGTAALKIAVSGQHFPLFVEGFLSGVNYALSFIVMQVLGFTLATKQPSMTAATLAGAIRKSEAASGTGTLTTYVTRIIRSQLAAAMGNILTVSLAGFGLDYYWRWRTGHAFLPADRVDYVVHSFHPWQSGTIWYASLTGVILWLSSLAAGWIENFAVYRRLPQAIAEHRLSRVVGERAMRGLSRYFARSISGFGGSAALGFMLGMTPVLGKFFGLPLDVRHVTLSTGTLAMAVASEGTTLVREPRFLLAVAGIAVIFVCNLTVSFTLALTVALRAREVPMRHWFRLMGALTARFARHPIEFVFPPRDEAGNEH